MSQRLYRSTVLVGSMLLAVCSFVPSAAADDWLDIDATPSWVTGFGGSFTGFLGSIPVNGNYDSNLSLSVAHSGPGGTHGDSTIDNTSPQFSYPSVFNPTIPLTDRLGYIKGATAISRITINFGSPVTNPVFHIANLDRNTFDFAPTPGLLGMPLQGSNGGSNDGLAVIGTTLRDINRNTVVGWSADLPPLTTGDRSAYGSVQLTGTFSQLLIDVTNNQVGGDGGSFTISKIPEPASLVLVLAATSGLAFVRRRQPRMDGGAAH